MDRVTTPSSLYVAGTATYNEEGVVTRLSRSYWRLFHLLMYFVNRLLLATYMYCREMYWKLLLELDVTSSIFVSHVDVLIELILQ